MTEWLTLIAALCAAVGGLCGAVAGVASLTRAFRIEASVQEIHLQVNSRLDQLLAATSANEHAAGVVQGVAQEKTDAAERRAV